ncbi:AIR carboxylase [Symmachiella dynata]|uniref:AIR carboxylase n=1 Tax=Symmachiella dynata TaxID=2527995 RepID=A0A517ZUG9_9PLAN|nr:nickel pincer cofactor biosynthesis protein LarB [Symmachiella dynata]QDU46119.1 AIR carboxylase [Symmachiella dynata]
MEIEKTQLLELLESLSRGDVSPEGLIEQLETARSVGTHDAQVDVDRQQRCGFPEVVFCEGKTAAAIADIFRVLIAQKQDCFGTRLSADKAESLLEWFPEAQHNGVARTIRIPLPDLPEPTGNVVVITAGTGDRPVAEEAVETARWMGCNVRLIVDIGVAGPHRLLQEKQNFVGADAVVVAAGMEGALPSVVGGHVACPVIAVPTSIGYGASFGGLAALLGMVNSCAANVTVVNIDAGFKGGYLAGLIARQSAPRNVTS